VGEGRTQARATPRLGAGFGVIVRRGQEMPKTIYIPEDARHSGIDITWTPSAGRLDIGGWYDTMVGIQPGSMTLAEFFAKLGITEKDVRKALSANTKGHRPE